MAMAAVTDSRQGSICGLLLFLSFVYALRMGNYFFANNRSRLAALQERPHPNPRASHDDDDDDDSASRRENAADAQPFTFSKLLPSLNSVPLVPHVNRSIPAFSDADSDRQRLLGRLHDYGLQEKEMSGDGNCQFRAISDQLYGTPEKHKYVRKQVVYQLKASEDLYQEYVPMNYDEYVRQMGRVGEWGDHVTLQAAADYFGMRIWLVTSFKDTTFMEIAPKTPKENEDIFLSFWAEVHYNSLYENPGCVLPSNPKKKHWML